MQYILKYTNLHTSNLDKIQCNNLIIIYNYVDLLPKLNYIKRTWNSTQISIQFEQNKHHLETTKKELFQKYKIILLPFHYGYTDPSQKLHIKLSIFIPRK